MRPILGMIVLAMVVGTVPAGEIKIAWHGQSMFLIVTPKGTRVVIDPHNLEAYRVSPMKADLVLLSHFHTDHTKVEVIENIKEAKQFNALKKSGPGDAVVEFNSVDEKIGDVQIQSVGSYHDQMGGLQRGKNGIWILEIEGTRIVHLGDLGHELNRTQLKKIGQVDVLLVPVGGVYTLNGIEAFKVVEQIKPRRYIVPMHFGTIVYSDLLPINYFQDEIKEAGYPIVRLKPREWLTIDTAVPLPKQPSMAILDYSGPPIELKPKAK